MCLQFHSIFVSDHFLIILISDFQLYMCHQRKIRQLKCSTQVSSVLMAACDKNHILSLIDRMIFLL